MPIRPFDPPACALLLLAAAAPLHAQDATTPPAADWRADSQAVAEASAAWMRALQAHDTAALDSLMAPEFHLSAPVDGDRAPLPRATWLANLDSLVATDSAAWVRAGFRRVTPDVVVGSGLLHWEPRLRGWPMPIHRFAVTDVWVRRDGRWRVAARDGDFAPGTLFRIGALLGAGAVGACWALTAWWRRRRLRRAAR